MDISFFDQNLRLVRVIDEYKTCIFRSKWTDYGSFEIYIDQMDQELFQMGNIIMVDGDERKSGRIEYVSASDQENGEAVIKGHTLL